jgi:hypothetical protein
MQIFSDGASVENRRGVGKTAESQVNPAESAAKICRQRAGKKTADRSSGAALRQAEAAEKENQIKKKKMTAIPSSHGRASACWTCDKVIRHRPLFSSGPHGCSVATRDAAAAIVTAFNDRCSRVDTTHQTKPQTIASAGSCFD